jgi:hypothetical protein
MAEIKDQVEIKKATMLITNDEYTELFDEKIDPEDLPKSLKQEILYIIYGMPDGKKPSDYNADLVKVMVDADGYLRGYHYIDSTTANGKNKTYIYDENRDIIYKVPVTKLAGNKVHSYIYACKIMGYAYDKVKSPEYTIEESSEMIISNGIACYAPNLQNFRAEKISLVYYEKYNTENTKEYEYLISGAKEVKIDGKNYMWYDYSEDNKIWANIKSVNNEVESYWVWIPRYAYKINDDSSVDIKYVNLQNQYYDSESNEYKNLDSEYIVAEAFNQEGAEKGIWMSKYEPSAYNLGYKESTDPDAVNAPDLSGFDLSSTYYITYDADGNEIATPITDINYQPEGWYDYTNKQWANIKTVANGIEAYWVWIPRYAYRVDSGKVEIIYIDTNNKPLDSTYDSYGYKITTDDSGDFKVAEAFLQSGAEKGFWMSKYEPSKNGTE